MNSKTTQIWGSETEPTGNVHTSLVVGAEPTAQADPWSATPTSRRNLQPKTQESGCLEHGVEGAQNTWGTRERTPALLPKRKMGIPPPDPASAVTQRAAAAADGGERRRRSATCESLCIVNWCSAGSLSPVGLEFLEECNLGFARWFFPNSIFRKKGRTAGTRRRKCGPRPFVLLAALQQAQARGPHRYYLRTVFIFSRFQIFKTRFYVDMFWYTFFLYF
jgi:hypothetical protein